MQRAFNKLGSIEIEENTMKYRIESQEIGTDVPMDLEKDIKRKLQIIDSQDRFLLPYDIQTINRYMVLYYNLANYAEINALREIPLEDKIEFFMSLVELGKIHEKGLSISWDRMNFVVDKYDKSIKALLFETDHLKIYNKPEDITKTVIDFIITSMTVLNTVVSLPKRNDFIYTDDENIQFVEKLYRLDSLDDVSMYLETVLLDIDVEKSRVTDITRKNKKERSTAVVGKTKKKQEKKIVKPKSKPHANTGNISSKQKKDAQFKKTIIILGGVATLLLLLSFVMTPSEEVSNPTVIASDSNMAKSEIFKGNPEYDNELVEAYRRAYNSEYGEAFNLLSTISKENLNDADVELLIEVYEQTSNLHVLLDEVPALANDVITYLFTRDKLQGLTEIAGKMKTKNPYIEFEKAHLTQQFEYMLSVVDSIQINGRKEQQIIDAYLALERIEEANRFAEDVGNPDLIKRVEQYRK
jgi:hypothetical protein